MNKLLGVVFLTLCLSSCSDYIYIDISAGNMNDISISVESEVLVERTVVDYGYEGDYLVGIRLNVYDEECARGIILVIDDKPQYFFVNMKTGEFQQFSLRSEFVSSMKNKGVLTPFRSIDESKAEEVWQYYNKQYLRYCKKKRVKF